jgi:hypothetical protein
MQEYIKSIAITNITITTWLGPLAFSGMPPPLVQPLSAVDN